MQIPGGLFNWIPRTPQRPAGADPEMRPLQVDPEVDPEVLSPTQPKGKQPGDTQPADAPPTDKEREDREREERRLQLTRVFERRVFRVIAFLQLVTYGGLLGLVWWVGVVWWPWLAGLIVCLGVTRRLNTRLKEQIDSPGRVRRRSLLWWLMWIGGVLVLLIQAGVAVALAERTRFHGGLLGIVAIGLIVVLGFLALRASNASIEAGRAPWVAFGAALILLPLLGGWWVATALFWGWALVAPLVSEPHILAARRAPAAACGDSTEWKRGDQPIEVAIALSGGGYRAALTHAGVLAALDDHCVPIGVLSTVSGGSIIGAAYALGTPPREFARQLHGSRPGLPDELLNFVGFFNEWLNPWSSNSEVYARHFRHGFFGNRTLADLRERPVLLVNATDLEATGDHGREIFFKGRAPGLDHATAVADVVAASGAFPVAFEPKRLSWIRADGSGPVVTRKFVDGGVVENLGVEGLRRYLTLGRPSAAPARPHLLIISDASRRGAAQEFPNKLGIVDAVERAQGISYDALHRHLYARLSGRADFFWDWVKRTGVPEQISSVPWAQIDGRLGDGQPDRLLTVVIPITAPETQGLLAAYVGCQPDGRPVAKLQAEVAEYDTLKEPPPERVEHAFALGYALGTIYWQAINCARERVARGVGRCGVPLPDPAALVCPTFNDLLKPAAASRS